MYVIYSLRECHYLKRTTKIDVKLKTSHRSLGLLRQTMMISSADHFDLSAVCQVQAYQIAGQQKSGPL